MNQERSTPVRSRRGQAAGHAVRRAMIVVVLVSASPALAQPGRAASGGTEDEPVELWFKVVPPSDAVQGGEKRVFDADTERFARSVLTSGDGLTPETAFVVGGAIGAEYAIMHMMGIKPGSQALVFTRGCSFDILNGTDEATGEARRMFFKLGRSRLDPQGPCVLGDAQKP